MKNIGRYIVEELIATGGFSTVYRCRDPNQNISVAVKVFGISPNARSSNIIERTEHWKDSFNGEARLLLGMEHPHIVKVIEYGELMGSETPFFVMPFLPTTLVDVIGEDISDPDHINALDMDRRPKSINEHEAVRVLKQILMALETLHHRGFVHRDIKPENILLTDSNHGDVKLCDFGIMAQLGSEQARECVGSVDYQCPEQKDDGVKVDVRADIYSVGALAYRMLTGEVTEGYTPPPEVVKPELNLNLCALVVSAMETHRNHRPKDATTMLAELNRLFPLI